MMKRFSIALPIVAATVLAGCQAEPEASADDGEVGTVERTAIPNEEPAGDSQATPAASSREPLRIGSGLAGRDAALEQVNVAGDVLTVQVRYFMANSERGSYQTERFPVDEVSVIDDGTAQELGVLQDNRGQFLAAPLDEDDKTKMAVQLFGDPAVVWFKFPAPNPETRTVSINIPGTAPFDGVPVNRY